MGARIEQEFGARVPMSALFESATVQHLVSRLDESAPAAPALVPVQPAGSRRPFFCVHEFFGDVLLFQRLARRLGDEQPFWGLQAMGVDGNAEPVSDIPAMAASYIAAMRTVQREGPYTLGGMCAGGLVALEVAQQLRASGEDVALLALLDSSAWSFVPANERPAHEHSILDFLRDVPQWLRGLADLTREQRRDVLRLKAGLWRERLTGDHGPATGPEGIASDRRIRAIGRVFRLSRHQRRVAHAFREALRAYRPQPYAGRMVLFRARMQPLFGSHDRTKGWHALAAGEFEVRTVHGNHLGMLQEPHVVVLAEALAAALDAG
jgi:thioesterase domain-containing protein